VHGIKLPYIESIWLLFRIIVPVDLRSMIGLRAIKKQSPVSDPAFDSDSTIISCYFFATTEGLFTDTGSGF